MSRIVVRPFSTSDLGILATRPRGYLVGRRVATALAESGPVVVDFKDVLSVDVTAADEAVAKPLRAACPPTDEEQGPLILVNLGDAPRESIGCTLRNRAVAALEWRDHQFVPLGKLEAYLIETFGEFSGGMTLCSTDVGNSLGIDAKTACTRLINLHKLRLLCREHDSTEPGRAWYIYRLPPLAI